MCRTYVPYVGYAPWDKKTNNFTLIVEKHINNCMGYLQFIGPYKKEIKCAIDSSKREKFEKLLKAINHDL